jgi:hypothetical protein
MEEIDGILRLCGYATKGTVSKEPQKDRNTRFVLFVYVIQLTQTLLYLLILFNDYGRKEGKENKTPG